MRNKMSDKKFRPISSGIDITLEELIALRCKVLEKPMHSKKESRALFSGQNTTKIRGRGIEFDTTREYQPGDDIRRMAWRVTARSLQPHVKIYHEERERPVWLAVDLSPSLYFGTRQMFKSVCSIKQAAFLGWSYLQNRERIGAVIATPQQILSFKPQSREREFLLVLKSLAECSENSPTYTEKNCLQPLLSTMQQHIRAGNVIFILSDFLHFDTPNKKLILHCAQRAQVKLIFVYDPFEAMSPPAHQYVLTDGQNTALFNMAYKQNRKQYQEQFQNKLNDVTVFARMHGIPLQVIRTDVEG